IKHAQDLEESIVAYKTAETHLYKVHEENGEDLLDFAHPEGDFKVGDSKDGLGDVETNLSAHKKMVDVVNKTPTGKLAMAAMQILKTSQWGGQVSDEPAQQVEDGRTKCVQSLGSPSNYNFTLENLYNSYSVGGDNYSNYFEEISGK